MIVLTSFGTPGGQSTGDPSEQILFRRKCTFLAWIHDCKPLFWYADIPALMDPPPIVTSRRRMGSYWLPALLLCALHISIAADERPKALAAPVVENAVDHDEPIVVTLGPPKDGIQRAVMDEVSGNSLFTNFNIDDKGRSHPDEMDAYDDNFVDLREEQPIFIPRPYRNETTQRVPVTPQPIGRTMAPVRLVTQPPQTQPTHSTAVQPPRPQPRPQSRPFQVSQPQPQPQPQPRPQPRPTTIAQPQPQLQPQRRPHPRPQPQFLPTQPQQPAQQWQLPQASQPQFQSTPMMSTAQQSQSQQPTFSQPATVVQQPQPQPPPRHSAPFGQVAPSSAPNQPLLALPRRPIQPETAPRVILPPPQTQQLSQTIPPTLSPFPQPPQQPIRPRPQPPHAPPRVVMPPPTIGPAVAQNLRTGVCHASIFYISSPLQTQSRLSFTHFAIAVSVDQCARTCHEFNCAIAHYDPLNGHCQFNPSTAFAIREGQCPRWPAIHYRNNVVTSVPIRIFCVQCHRPFRRGRGRSRAGRFRTRVVQTQFTGRVPPVLRTAAVASAGKRSFQPIVMGDSFAGTMKGHLVRQPQAATIDTEELIINRGNKKFENDRGQAAGDDISKLEEQLTIMSENASSKQQKALPSPAIIREQSSETGTADE
ncbi:Titin [Toxocara canis]|uniref:Titin n=1 Tax=Toxocara canis TaxID=6265 RepID=A0A0B2UUP3_TOXCA|nr:Titin [Toxocara canis]